MDLGLFWQVIDDVRRPDLLDHVAALTDRLGDLKWFEIVRFQELFEELVAGADRPDLRAASVLINGDESGEGFRDFRAWLVGRGRGAYEAALQNPDALADSLDGDPADGFGLLAAALRAYEQRTGMSDFYQRLARPPEVATAPDAPITDEHTLRERFPRLSALYPPPPAEDPSD